MVFFRTKLNNNSENLHKNTEHGMGAHAPKRIKLAIVVISRLDVKV